MINITLLITSTVPSFQGTINRKSWDLIATGDAKLLGKNLKTLIPQKQRAQSGFS